MKNLSNDVKFDKKEILDLILKTPNDMDLGKKIRAYCFNEIYKNKKNK
jgi:hypothetical protein